MRQEDFVRAATTVRSTVVVDDRGETIELVDDELRHVIALEARGARGRRVSGCVPARRAIRAGRLRVARLVLPRRAVHATCAGSG